MSDLEFRRDIVRIGRMLHDKGFIAANDGNISVRLNEFTVLATPTCMSKGMLTEEDLVTVDVRGKKLSGFREVSSEIAMHLMIYRVRPDVSAVVHAHPPTATGFAAAGRGLDEALVSEIVISLGKVPLSDYATPGTTDLCDCIEPFVEDHDAVLMANHGVVTCGDDLLTAYMNMETVEHYAKISLVAHQLGTKCPLSDEQVEGLLKIRHRIREMRSLQKNRA
jgi:L-fuculose-phosphate aldolase